MAKCGFNLLESPALNCQVDFTSKTEFVFVQVSVFCLILDNGQNIGLSSCVSRFDQTLTGHILKTQARIFEHANQYQQ